MLTENGGNPSPPFMPACGCTNKSTMLCLYPFENNYYKITCIYITRALIGRNPCLDQAIQTRKTIVLLLFYKTITLWFPCLDGLIQTLGNVARVKKNERNTSRRRVILPAFLATFPRVWIRPSKHGNHKVIV